LTVDVVRSMLWTDRRPRTEQGDDVTSATEAALRDALTEAETRMQDCLAQRPPPFFVKRQLNLSDVAAGDRVRLLLEIFPTVDDPVSMEMLALADAGAFTQRDDAACLNRYFYNDVEQLLESSAAQARGLLERTRAAEVGELVYAATELIGYLLVEKCWWHFITQPLGAIRYDQAVMSEAASLLAAALEEARHRRDWLRWHRIAANRARLGYLAGDPSPTLALTFDQALGLGQLCLDHGIVVDRVYPARRDELLHMAATVKFIQRSLTYQNLSAHIKSPARIKPPPSEIRLTIESGKLIGNLSLPLAVGMAGAVEKAGAHAAFVDVLSTEDRVQLWIQHKGRVASRSLMYRDLHALENLDLMFRPSLFEVTLEDADRPFVQADAEGPATDRIAYVGRRLQLGSEVIDGKKWLLRFPTLELGLDGSGARYRRETNPDVVGVPWERALGALLEHELPGPPDRPQHLVISTDGPLSLLPIHLARMPDGRLLCERFRVSYAPSLAYFVPAPSIGSGQPPSVVVLLDSRNGLQGPIWELERMRRRVGATGLLELDGFEGDDRALQDSIATRDVIHVATHAALFTHTPELSGIELRSDRMLTLRTIERLTLKPGCLVFLNACESSRVAIRSRIEFSSIANAFLSAGASTVIATFWEAEDTPAALLSDLFYRGLLEQRRGRLESLNAAIRALQDIDLDEISVEELGPLASSLPAERKQPYRNPSYWGQYALFGRW
jgi:hypothetical protein